MEHTSTLATERPALTRTLLTRRGFVARLSGAALIGSIAQPLLAACTPSPTAPKAATAVAPSASGTVKLPSYIPVAHGPTPDLAGTADGVDAAFFALP